MWLISTYEPVSLFSLRYSSATTAGAKSLLVPSPYTIKMALTVAAIRLEGKEFARTNFLWIREMRPIRVRPSHYAVVNRCFLKFQSKRSEKSAKPKTETGEIDPNYEAPIGYAATVGFREYIHLYGPLEIAFPIDDLQEHQLTLLRRLLPQINTFGKRGSLFQFLKLQESTELDDDFSTALSSGGLGASGIVQPLDDMASSVTFEKVDVTDSSQKVNRSERLSQPTLIALRSTRFAQTWAFYEKADDG